MVASLSFGNFATVNGKNVLAGSQSGIDTTSLINALATAKAQPATVDQTKITANQAQMAALNQLQTLMTNLQTSLNGLRNPGGVSSTGDTDVFDARTPFLSITNGLTASDYIGVQTANGAPIGNYTMQVDNLASAETLQSGTFSSRTASVVGASSTNTANQFAAGTFYINGIAVTLNQNSSLNDVAAAIQAVSSQSGVGASIVGLSSNSYELVLTGTKTGAANSITITDPNGVLPTAGTVPVDPNTSLPYPTTGLPAGETMFGVKQAAADAQFEFNGQTITRPTNTITDLLDNTTISLFAPTGAGNTVSLSIDKNDQSIATAVGNFVTAYNAIKTFVAQQSQRNASGNLVSSAVLNNNPTLNSVTQSLNALLTGQLSVAIPSAYQSGTTSAPVRLGDLGITLTDQPAGSTTDASGNTVATPEVDNILTIDPSVLGSNLDSFFTDVQKIFEFSFTPSTADLSVFQRDNTVTNANFSIAVNTSLPIGQQAQITLIDGSGLTAPIDLLYNTTTTQKSAEFTDPNTTSVVNAASTDTPGQFAAGTFQINGVNVTLNQNDTLQDVVNDINNATGSGATATLVNDGVGVGYSISLVGTAAGTSGINITDPSGVLPSTGMFNQVSSTSIISGAPNTDLSGLSFNYSGNGNETITKSNPTNSKDFTMAIDTTQPVGSQAEITKIFGATLTTPIAMTYTQNGAGSALISGTGGTPFAGLQMIYTGTGTDTINVAMQQGIADQMYNSLDSLINGSDGSKNGTDGIIAQAVNSLTTQDNTLQDSITTINSQVATYRSDLLTKYANMEAAISSANNLLQLLSSQDNAALAASGH